MRAEWTPEAGRLVSLSQFQDFDTHLSETNNARPLPVRRAACADVQRQALHQELRWHSQITDDIGYLFGGFTSTRSSASPTTSSNRSPGRGSSVSGDSDNDTYAVFTNVDYRLDEQWSFSLGGRYNDETESIDSRLDLSALLGGGSGNINIGNVQDEVSDGNTSFSVKSRYQYDDNMMFYASWDTAYKSGGYNPQVANISDFFVGNENIATLEDDFLLYPEKLPPQESA